MAQLHLLCCKAGDLTLAIPLDRVIGVVETGPLTPLPYSADAFEGLVDAIGQVMPRINLAKLLGCELQEGKILVVVMDKGGSLALRVQQVTSMVNIENDQILAHGAEARAVHELFLSQFAHSGQTHYLLDIDRLALSEQLRVLPPDGEVMLAEAPTPDLPEELLSESHTPFLLVEIGAKTYAFESSEVEELTVPGPLRTMPGSPEWILGLIDLRGKPVVALSTALLLGQPRTGAEEICLVAELDAGLEVALFVDRALSLERFPPEQIYPMNQSMAGVNSYLVLEADHIVGVISPVKLVEQVRAELVSVIPFNSRQQADTGAPKEPSQSHQLLTVRVGDELFGLTLERIERILASVRLTPLPSTAEHFDGMADVGDGVIPVIDLRKQVARLEPPSPEAQPPCLLTMLEGAMAGILVDQVLSISEVPAERFESVKDGSKLPISHVVPLEGRLISVLTIDRILPAA
jgi:chemotaxis signal transduction protein